MPLFERRRTLLLSDYSGHGFTYELANDLHERGTSVSYTHCVSTLTPKATFSGSVPVHPIRSGRNFEKYRLWKRAVSEVRYGIGTARVVLIERPAVHVVCNMPLVTAAIVWAAGLLTRTRFVVWLQDVQSGLAVGSLRSGPALAAIRRLEAFVLRRAERVVAISEPLADSARGFGVRRDRVVLLRNWAPIGSIPDLDRANRWSAEHGLDDRFVFMYAGTLARKHRPDLLLALAREMSSEPDVAVVVVSEGEGADELRRQRAASPDLDRLVVLDYQPFDRLAEVLAAADVLIVLLEPVASSHSVPSKTLSYLCAGRPVLAAVPSENDAVRILVEEAGAGVVVAPDDTEGFISGAAALRRDPDRCGRLGASGRAYAEREFASDRVVAGFVSAIGLEGIEV